MPRFRQPSRSTSKSHSGIRAQHINQRTVSVAVLHERPVMADRPQPSKAGIEPARSDVSSPAARSRAQSALDDP